MFIQTEQTPNPASLKFLPGGRVAPAGGIQFESASEAAASPLAARLFAIAGVTAVYLGADFITVTKNDSRPWPVLKPEILGAIMDHHTSGEPTLVAAAAGGAAGSEAAADDELVAKIKELIETRVRPAVAQDGGDIVFQGFEKGVVYLRMRGACAGCPSSTATLKMGIENMLKHYVPEVAAVQAV
jgi:Fe-S cluster biogenesis protein NfuA